MGSKDGEMGIKSGDQQWGNDEIRGNNGIKNGEMKRGFVSICDLVCVREESSESGFN